MAQVEEIWRKITSRRKMIFYMQSYIVPTKKKKKWTPDTPYMEKHANMQALFV